MSLSKSLLAGPLLIFLSCTKDDKVNDCEKNNFGTVTIQYTGTTMRHSILITPLNSTMFREKISATGVLQDTVQLAVGDQYTLSISSITDEGTAVQQNNKQVTTTQCSNNTITEQF